MKLIIGKKLFHHVRHCKNVMVDKEREALNIDTCHLFRKLIFFGIATDLQLTFLYKFYHCFNTVNT